MSTAQQEMPRPVLNIRKHTGLKARDAFRSVDVGIR